MMLEIMNLLSVKMDIKTIGRHLLMLMKKSLESTMASKDKYFRKKYN